MYLTPFLPSLRKIRAKLPQSRARLALLVVFTLFSSVELAWLSIAFVSCHPGSIFVRNCTFVWPDVVAIITAVGFWTAGLFGWSQRQRLPTTAFFFNVAGALVAGLVSGTDGPAGIIAFYLHLAFLAPLTVHFYLDVQGSRQSRFEKALLWTFYGIAVALSASVLWMTGSLFLGQDLPPLIRVGVRIDVLASFVYTFLLLFYNYIHYSNLAARRRVRMFLMGSLFAFGPLLLLTLLSQTLFIFYLSGSYTFPFLLLIPVVSVYSIFRSRFSYAENAFRQVLAYYLLGVILLCVGLIILTFASRYAVPSEGTIGLMIAASAVLILLFQRPVRMGIEWAFYGSEAEYAHALSYLEQSISRVIKREEVTNLLLNELVAAVKPAGAILFLYQKKDGLAFAGCANLPGVDLNSARISVDGPLCLLLAGASEPVETEQIARKMEAVALPEDEKRLLLLPNISLWIPFHSANTVYGLMLISFRAGDDLFTVQDKRLLSSIMGKAGLAIRTVALAESFQEGQEELAKAHKMLLESQEQERKRIARELHDGTIQQLIGISYQLNEYRRSHFNNHCPPDLPPETISADLDDFRQELLSVVAQVRGVIGELRPAGLDELGLSAAIEGFIQNLVQSAKGPTPQVEVYIGDDLSFLSDDQTICLFRVAQEALRNAFKYSRATTIFLRLFRQDNEAIIEVHDDGVGFELTERLSELAKDNHFGLIGIKERAQYAGGSASITSALGDGTSIVVKIPVS